MVRSMTGFGRFEEMRDGCKVSVEMRAVNHRYLDLGIKMPRKFNCFEARIRSLLKDYVQRGKVDLSIGYEDYAEGRAALVYNRALAAEYVGYFAEMSREFGISNDMAASTLARCPEVLAMGPVEEDEERQWRLLSEALLKAAGQFVESRSEEGERLKADLLEKLDSMDRMVDFIEERSPEILAQYRLRLEEKVRELLGGSGLDEARVMAEVVLYADKICVDEETVRLRSHIRSARAQLEAGGSVGRKLDFIAQEMNREANTILSKSGHLSVSDKAIELKTEIEKVREQIQNLE